MRFFCWVLILLFPYSFAVGGDDTLLPETQRPKVGLCLSGGAAKGLAYIPLLEKIDSLGIKIDYITGTSMGALVGGLYAIGYTGKELRQIALEMDWDFMLSDALPMYKVNMEEKDEYDRYILELSSPTAKPGLPLGLIQGQNIMRMLNDLTFRAAHIHDFKDFPIPFKCVATDIVTNQPIVFDKGSLAMAMRASMSLPSIFTPVDTAKYLLVDGGLVKNFPVEYLKDMGADFVIGGNTSGNLYKKKQLNSLFTILGQMTSFSIADDYQKQKVLCDILIDYTALLDSSALGSADFKKAADIIKVGEVVLQDFIPALEQLAANQHKYVITPYCEEILNLSNHLPVGKIQLSFEQVPSVILNNKIQINENEFVEKSKINQSVERIYGTTFFDKVYYQLEPGNDDYNLVFKTIGTKKFAYKVGIHYDNEISAGIILNFTYRNLSKFPARIITTIDISDNPKLRAGYQVYFGDSGWWFKTDHLIERVFQNAYFNRKSLGYYNQYYYLSDFSLNKTFGQNSSLSLGSALEWQSLKSDINSDERFSQLGEETQLNRYPYLNTHVFLKFKVNTLDRPFLPKKGKYFQLDAKTVLWGNTKVGLQVRTLNGTEYQWNDSTLRYNFGPYARIGVQYKQFFPVHKKVTFSFKAAAGVSVIFKPQTTNYAVALYDGFYIGGVDQRERERYNLIPFWGNKELFVQTLNYALLSFQVQTEVFKNLYISPTISGLLYDKGSNSLSGDDGFISNFVNVNPAFAFSGGASVIYDSPIGPMQINLSMATNTSLPRGYVSLGYRF